MVDERREGFWNVLAASLFPIIAFSGSFIAAVPIAAHLQIGPPGRIVMSGIMPGFLGIVATVIVERRLEGGSVHEAVRRLGVGRPSMGQVGVGAVAVAPIAIAYAILFGPLGLSSALVAYFPLQVFKYVIAQGIAEEVIFRGFVFRRLRGGRSFARAATLSAIVFSLIHLAMLVHGISISLLIGVGVSLFFGVLLTYPAAYLFERGGNSIWGFGLLHVAIDSIDLFKQASEPGIGLAVYLTAVVATVPVVFGLGHRLLRRAPV